MIALINKCLDVMSVTAAALELVSNDTKHNRIKQ